METVIIYDGDTPKAFDNLKTLCDYISESYHIYKAEKFPFMINEIWVYKVELIRGGEK